MSLVQSFSAAQSIGNPSVIFLTDTSTGTDVLVKSRIVYLQKHDGSYLKEDNAGASPIPIVAEVKAKSYMGGISLGATNDVYLSQVNDPVLGLITVGSYTQVGGETLDTLITGIINSINNGGTGYTAENYTSTTLNFISKAGLGATINGNLSVVSWASNSTNHAFADGVTAVTLPIAGQDYIYWNYADTSKSIDILKYDMALKIKVQWLGVSNNVLYEKETLYPFTMYAEMFDDFLISGQQANPNKVNSTDYYLNRIKLRVAINDAKNSVVLMNSIGNSQEACDRATYLIANASKLF